MLAKKILSSAPFTFKTLQAGRSSFFFSASAKKTYYQILDVPEEASLEQIKQAYYKLAKQHHPDVNVYGAIRFKEISMAYKTLTDDKLRNEYDDQIHSEDEAYQQSRTSYKTTYSAGYSANNNRHGTGSYTSSTSEQYSQEAEPEMDPNSFYGSYWKGKGYEDPAQKRANRERQGPNAEKRKQAQENIERMAEEAAQSARRKMILFCASFVGLLVILKIVTVIEGRKRNLYLQEEKKKKLM